MFSDPIAGLMAAASTRRALTEPQRRLVRPARPRRAVALVLHTAAHRLDPDIAASLGR